MVLGLLRYYEGALTALAPPTTSDTLIGRCPLKVTKSSRRVTHTGLSNPPRDEPHTPLSWSTGLPNSRLRPGLSRLPMVSRLGASLALPWRGFGVPPSTQRPQFIPPHWHSALRFQPAHLGSGPHGLPSLLRHAPHGNALDVSFAAWTTVPR